MSISNLRELDDLEARQDALQERMAENRRRLQKLEDEMRLSQAWMEMVDQQHLAMFTFNMLCDLARTLMERNGIIEELGEGFINHSIWHTGSLQQFFDRATFNEDFGLKLQYFNALGDMPGVRSSHSCLVSMYTLMMMKGSSGRNIP